MNSDPITAAELYRLFAILGAGIIGLSGITATIGSMLGARRMSRKDAQEEGERRQQLKDLLKLAERNEITWEHHRQEVREREDLVHETREQIAVMVESQKRLAGDVGRALEASTAAGEAVTKLATGLAVQVRFGDQKVL